MDIHLDSAVGYAQYPGVKSNGNPDMGAGGGNRSHTKDAQVTASGSGGVSRNPLSLKDITTLITTMDLDKGNLVRVLDSVPNESNLRSLLKNMQ